MTTMRSFAHCVRFKAILASYLCLGMGGCASSFKLPPIQGKALTYVRSDVWGGTTITAKDVQITEEQIKAGLVTWTTKYPFFSISLTVEEYQQTRTKEPPKP